MQINKMSDDENCSTEGLNKVFGNMTKNFFGPVDYGVFIGMLAISACIGIYYGYKGRKKADTEEFLMGGRKLSVFPVAMSVMASFVSAITLLGSPSEVYRYGAHYFLMSWTFLVIAPTTAYLYLPVFYNLQLTSAYEYLEVRFQPFVRTLGTVIFIMHMMMYMPIVLYAPALALAEVTGFQLWYSVLSVSSVCIFYTSIGGMKAVILTDLFQSLIMNLSLAVIIFKSAQDLGGWDVVINRTQDGGRFEFFNFSPDPTVSYSTFAVMIGSLTTWLGLYAANQANIQRYLTVNTLRGAQICVWINFPALVLIISLTTLAGLVIYAYYYNCDPIGTKQIEKPDQLFPRFVMDAFTSMPGIPGLFVSGIFSGSLSTVSSGVNSLAAVTLEDIIKIYVKQDITEKTANRVIKLMALGYGVVCVGLVAVVQQFTAILQAALIVLGAVSGPKLALFTLGMFFHFVSTSGAVSGLLCGFASSLFVGFGRLIFSPFVPEKPRSYDGCKEIYFNITGIEASGFIEVPPTVNNTQIFYLFRLSHFFVSTIGFVVAMLVGLSVSVIGVLMNKEVPYVDDSLLNPVGQWFKKRCFLEYALPPEVGSDDEKDITSEHAVSVVPSERAVSLVPSQHTVSRVSGTTESSHSADTYYSD